MSGTISLDRRVRLAVGAGIGAALLTLAPIASAGGAVAVPLAPSIVELAPDPPHQWSLQNLDGTPATSGQLFDGKLIVPGVDLESGYRIVHTSDIDGPLEVRAEAMSAPSAFENRLSVIVGVNGKPGESVRLSSLLRGNGVATATEAMPAGPVRLDISLRLDPSSTNELQEDELSFRFRITVSDVDFTVPTLPGTGTNGPGAGNGGGSNGNGNGGTNGSGIGTAGDPWGWGLPATGVTLPMAALIIGIVAVGAGIILVVGWRRRRTAGNPPPPAPR